MVKARNFHDLPDKKTIGTKLELTSTGNPETRRPPDYYRKAYAFSFQNFMATPRLITETP